MENCIFNDRNNDTIGFYKDIKAGLKKQAEEYIKSDNFEMAQEITDILLELVAPADDDTLLVLSDNNGMGWSIREYEKNIRKETNCENAQYHDANRRDI